MDAMAGRIPDTQVFQLTGPTRRQGQVPYLFHLIYRASGTKHLGCVLLWMIQGGREPYQIALERTEYGQMIWHCTCADFVYRRNREGCHCKHVNALAALFNSNK